MSRPNKPSDFLVTESEPMKAVAGAIEEVADSAVPVLVEGEPGTGRELIARVIHLTSSRRVHPFISVKGGTAPTGAFHQTSSATSSSVLARADGGTLVIKDFCALPRRSQERLLRILGTVHKGREGSVSQSSDLRVVATTDPDLSRAVDAGVISAELYRCFEKCRLTIPPLRERLADIPPLATSLIRGYAKTMGRKRIRISTRAFDRMISYAWPGNVAELKAVCRRVVVRAEDKIEPEDLEAVLPVALARAPLEETSFEDMVRTKLTEFLRHMDGYPVTDLYAQVLDRVERPLLAVLMEYTGGNQVKAAEILGLNRNTLRRKLVERGVRAQTLRARSTRKAASKRRGGKSS